MKAGWKTTEFWITVAFEIGAIATAATEVVGVKYAVFASAIAAGAYAVARGLAKVNAPPVPPKV